MDKSCIAMETSQNFKPRSCCDSFAVGTIKYVLLISNLLIISDAIFLLINEKDSYEGEFIEGRHPVSNFLLLMLYLDVESFLMILIGALGFVGTKNKNERLLGWYAVIMAVSGIISFPDLDATFGEVLISIAAIVYILLLKQKSPKSRKYSEIIATIA